jgi:trehalose 6-phosphate synthase/phosphatase
MRLIVVSNRLPVTVTERRERFRIQESVGGLVSGLQPTLQAHDADGVERLWIGWPGVVTGKGRQETLRDRLQEEQGCLPVFLSQATVNNFYRGFCNRTLWPLFHYFPTFAEYRERYWRAYRRVNETFADAVAAEAEPDDTIWVHDYHLMLLPRLLRERLPQATIGYFHHIPFPSFELYRLLPRPWGRALLEGLLGADLVGFHTYD